MRANILVVFVYMARDRNGRIVFLARFGKQVYYHFVRFYHNGGIFLSDFIAYWDDVQGILPTMLKITTEMSHSNLSRNRK